MKCDDFLPRLATGGWFSRWLARRHAVRCPRCAAAATLLRELDAERSEAPVPAQLRQAWLAAGRQERRQAAMSAARPAGRLRTRRLVAAACAAACLILLSVTVARWPAKPVRAPGAAVAAGHPSTSTAPPAPEAAKVAVANIDAAGQLVWLETRVVELQNDVERLAAEAQKRELSKRIEALLASHSEW